MPQYKTGESPYRVQVLDRSLAILEVLASRQSDFSLAELCASLKLHKSTIHRLAMVLEQQRLVERSPETGRYRLGLKLFELGSKAVAALDLREHSRPHLTRVMHETEETVHFCILDQEDVLYVEKMEPERSVRMASSVGRRMPAYCTAVGKAILALLPDAELATRLRRWELKPLTRKTITNAADLRAELQTIRLRGYAIDDEENEVGVRCVGAAVRNHMGRPVAAISVSGPAFRMSKGKVTEVARSVMGAANALSRELGYETERWSAARVGSD